MMTAHQTDRVWTFVFHASPVLLHQDRPRKLERTVRSVGIKIGAAARTRYAWGNHKEGFSFEDLRCECSPCTRPGRISTGPFTHLFAETTGEVVVYGSSSKQSERGDCQSHTPQHVKTLASNGFFFFSFRSRTALLFCRCPDMPIQEKLKAGSLEADFGM